MSQNYSNPFPFLDGLVHSIVEAIRSAIEDEMPEIMQEHNLIEHNGYGQFRWNPIISRLKSACEHIGWINVGTCKRGAWKVPVLFHSASGYILTLMTEPTLRENQRNKNKGVHYLCAATAKNTDVVAKEEQLQLELPSVKNDSKQWIAETQEQLATCVHAAVGEIAGHILIVFETNGDILSSIRAVRLTPKLEESTQEADWSSFIRMPLSSTDLVQPRTAQSDDEDVVLVELKGKLS